MQSEINERWERVWAAASEFERRRYRSLDPASQLAVLYLVPGGLPLGEAVRKATRRAGRLDGAQTLR
jgi:hypothetical protein